MLRWLGRLLLYRVLGGRAIAILTIAAFVRRLLGGRRRVASDDPSLDQRRTSPTLRRSR